MITDRSWNTIQAALRFWLEVTRTSRTPPWMHPRVRPFFENDRPTPLTPDEIETIINSDPVADRCLGYPLRVMLEVTGLTLTRMRRTLSALHLSPSGRAGRVLLWAWDDLRKAADFLLAKDREFKRKYAKPLAKTSN